jgi:hypothetical protein
MNGPFKIQTLVEYDGITVGDGTVGRFMPPTHRKLWSALRLVPRQEGFQEFDCCRLGFTFETWKEALAKAKAHKKNAPAFKYMVLGDYIMVENNCVRKTTLPKPETQEPKNPNPSLV